MSSGIVPLIAVAALAVSLAILAAAYSRNRRATRLEVDSPGHEDLASFARDYFRVYLQKNLGPPQPRIFATSDFTFYGDSLRSLRYVGNFFGVMTHEIAHSLDEIAPEGVQGAVDQVVAKFSVDLTPEDYAEFGEEELFADLMALDLYAKFGDELQNDLVFEHARLRRLPEHVYRPFMRSDLPDPGSTLSHAIAVDQLREEYEHVAARRCAHCNAGFEPGSLERRSNIVYGQRIHDILRLQCSSCGSLMDFFFDYTNTMPIPTDMREEYVKQVAAMFGEISDPLPEDIFTWKAVR